MRYFLALVFPLALPSRVHAEPLQLRANAFTDSRVPAGLLILEGRDKIRPWFDVEGLVWTGARPDATADVMTLALHLREPSGLGDVRGGRFVVATGAIRPVQIDGVSALARSRVGTSVEAFGGVPVVPRFGERSYSWIAGGRLSQSYEGRAVTGVSYVQRRTHGENADEEIGTDVAASAGKWLDLAGRGAYDLVSPGLTEATATISTRVHPLRFELFGIHRSTARLLPATSLFSVLGDFPAQSLGATILWKTAPRLDLFLSGAGQSVGGDLGANLLSRATLRLDDDGLGFLGLEVRKQHASTAKWTGVRAIASGPLGRGFRASTELELVVPDLPSARGSAWPWGIVSLSWRSASAWEIAAATEAASTPEHEVELNALARISRTWEVR